jgi:hypothetical protein
MQMDELESLEFEWETEEPEAGRGYWELRGPAVGSDRGRLLARGFLENQRDDGSVGGWFAIRLRDYISPVVPATAERYHVRVLPLPTPSNTFAAVALHRGHSFATIGQEPEPPVGVGPWSPPAIIDYGTEFWHPPTEFDIQQIDIYRKARVKIKRFVVDVDQGAGAEEYHIRAFVVEQTPLGSASLGSFGAYLGNASDVDLGWTSYVNHLGEPFSNIWPRLYFVALSVLETDSGDRFDEWMEIMTELASEALEGDLHDEVQDFLQEVREEAEEAAEEFNTKLADATVKYISALIGATALSAVAAIVAYAAALIGIFANEGSRDDFYGVEVITLALANNDVARIKDGSAGSIQSTRVLSAGGSLDGGTETNDRYTLDDIEIQLIDRGSAEAAGLGGIVRVALTWEFYDKVTRYF